MSQIAIGERIVAIKKRISEIESNLRACDGQPSTAYVQWLRSERTKCRNALDGLEKSNAK